MWALHLQDQSSWCQNSGDRERGGDHIPMPGQRGLAISRLRVPNLDGVVATAAGNFLSIGAPRHRVDPVIVIVRTPINRNKEEKNPNKTYQLECPVKKKLTNASARSASTGILQIASPKS